MMVTRVDSRRRQPTWESGEKRVCRMHNSGGAGQSIRQRANEEVRGGAAAKLPVRPHLQQDGPLMKLQQVIMLHLLFKGVHFITCLLQSHFFIG